MGKYMRKAKATGDLAVVEVPKGGGGVSTRAAHAAAAADSVGKSGGGGTSYIQLRSRLLIKKPTGSGVRRRRRRKGKGKEEGGEEEGKEEEVEGSKGGGDDPEGGKECGGAVGAAADNGEGSCGDNALELEGRERIARESTPCSLNRNTDGVSTPSSTTKPTGLTQTNRRGRGVDLRNIPSAHEMDDFFAGAEEEQQRSFIDKYNFDPVNEKPLPGRFEWEKLDP